MNLDADWPVHSEVGSTFELYADFPKGKENYLSVALDFYYVEINRAQQVMAEGSLGFKHAFKLNHQAIEFKPGFAIGYAYLADIGTMRPSNFLTTKLLLETHFRNNARNAWLVELALFYAPVGSNADEDLVFGPGLMLRVGLALR